MNNSVSIHPCRYCRIGSVGVHAADLAHRTRLPHLTELDIPHGVATAERRSGTDNRVSSRIRQGPIRPEEAEVQAPGARRGHSASRDAAADAQRREALPASGAVGWRKEVDPRWAPVHVVVAAVACRHGTNPPAGSAGFVVAEAGVPGRAEPPVAVGCTTSPSRSGLVKSAMVRAEMWMGSEAPAFPKKLRAPGGAEVDSALRWLRTGLDSWSWQQT